MSTGLEFLSAQRISISPARSHLPGLLCGLRPHRLPGRRGPKKRSSARVRPVCPRNRPGTRAKPTGLSLNSQVSPVMAALTGDHYAAFPWLKLKLSGRNKCVQSGAISQRHFMGIVCNINRLLPQMIEITLTSFLAKALRTPIKKLRNSCRKK